MWNAFPVKQCSIEERLTKPFLFWVGLVMLFKLVNLDTKIGGGHFGSRFHLFVVRFFGFPLFCSSTRPV